ncbi:MAG: rhomboid family intramembrane serine protease [Planctomycetia bacterium]|nr:rhomboid family intramembrane serine protease [Planctomycetia bacterium]
MQPDEPQVPATNAGAAPEPADADIAKLLDLPPEHERERPPAGEHLAMAEFHKHLAALTPRAWCTPALAIAIVCVFGTMVVSGVSAMNPAAGELLPWGANFGPRTMRGEWWRLETCTFLHSGIPHLAFNLVALYSIGLLVERLLGYNLILSATAKGIDHGAHLGGLAAGLVLGFVVGRPLDAHFLATRGLRNLAMAIVGIAAIGAAIAALPAAPRDPIAEWAALANEETQIVSRFSEFFEKAHGRQVDDATFVRRMKEEILPDWQKLREGWRSIRKLPGVDVDLIDGIDRCLGLRQESWEALVRGVKDQDAASIKQFQDQWAAANECINALNAKMTSPRGR